MRSSSFGGFADVYLPDHEERLALAALKKKPRKLGLRTEGEKVSARAARRLLSYGYARYGGSTTKREDPTRIYATEAGLEALSRS